ncbi:hypothetical protein [Streptomyces nanshensis]|uniref:Uncharacterized protein n=1 Tax=Streptomyces nanshensis TaxID=518642 RepID=A0A1E7LAC9_9ACTN|nr:hypothetical protein [Streptomyces nanshensis]OEV13202.1 hypothetical protein AN218_04610 [Streptomyces nanshensis]
MGACRRHSTPPHAVVSTADAFRRGGGRAPLPGADRQFFDRRVRGCRLVGPYDEWLRDRLLAAHLTERQPFTGGCASPSGVWAVPYALRRLLLARGGGRDGPSRALSRAALTALPGRFTRPW